MASEAGHATIINALLSCDGIDFEALDSEGIYEFNVTFLIKLEIMKMIIFMK